MFSAKGELMPVVPEAWMFDVSRAGTAGRYRVIAPATGQTIDRFGLMFMGRTRERTLKATADRVPFYSRSVYWPIGQGTHMREIDQ